MMGSANSTNAGQQHSANSTQPANHSESVIDAWYLVNHITRSLSPYYVLTRGFDITPQEYDAGHAMLIFLLSNITDGAPVVGKALWPVKEQFTAECLFWRKERTSKGVRIPEVWKRECLESWIEELLSEMRVKKLPVPVPHPTRIIDEPQERKESGPQKDTKTGPSLEPIGRPMSGCLDCKALNCKGHNKGMTVEPPIKKTSFEDHTKKIAPSLP